MSFDSDLFNLSLGFENIYIVDDKIYESSPIFLQSPNIMLFINNYTINLTISVCENYQVPHWKKMIYDPYITSLFGFSPSPDSTSTIKIWIPVISVILGLLLIFVIVIAFLSRFSLRFKIFIRPFYRRKMIEKQRQHEPKPQIILI